MKRILITEDDPLMAEIYRDTFDREGFSAETAANGAIAIQRLKGNPPDIVLLDLMMPNVNGVEVLKHIRAQESTRSLPVVVMTNALAGELGIQAASAGATRMFAKNACGPKRLVKEIKDLLNSDPQPEEETSSADGKQNNPLAKLREDAIDGMTQRFTEIRSFLRQLGQEDKVQAKKVLLDLHRAIHQLAGTAIFAGFSAVAQLACALETLVKDLHGKPEKLNPSSLSTATHAVDVLVMLSESANRQVEVISSSPLILVVDDDPISRKANCTALERTYLHAVRVDDPTVALRLAKENKFDLIFMDVAMPGMDGFETCRKIHVTSLNANTPVIFVTSFDDIITKARFKTSGGMDFINKPIWPTELGVKALTYLLRETVVSVNATRPAAQAPVS